MRVPAYARSRWPFVAGGLDYKDLWSGEGNRLNLLMEKVMERRQHNRLWRPGRRESERRNTDDGKRKFL